MIHIITAAHNRHNITIDFVQMIQKQTYQDTHIILVDDGSTDKTGEDVIKICPSSTVLIGSGNLWWGGALHKAFQWINSQDLDPEDYILISNDDVDYSIDYIEKALAILEQHNNSMLSGLGYSKTTGELVSRPLKWNYEKCVAENALDYHCTGNCVATRSLFLRIKDLKVIGGFHPVLLPHYFSDYEWTIRASRRGIKIIANDSVTFKFDDQTTGLRAREGQTVKQLFSKKSNANPFYRLMFIILVTPVHMWHKAIYHQIRRII